MRYFNTAGPCNKAKHYMVEAALRLQGVEQIYLKKETIDGKTVTIVGM